MSTAPRAVRLAALALLSLSSVLLVAAPDLLTRAGELQNRWDGRPDDPVVCSFRARTGRDCLGCRGTRALRLASRGELRASLRENPLGAWAGLGLWAGLLVAVSSLATGRGPAWRLLLVGYGTGAVLMFVWTFVEWWRRLPPGASAIR